MRVQITALAGYLLVEAAGRFDPAFARRAVDDIFAACAAHGMRRVLVDARELEAGVSVAERFELGRALAERSVAPVRIAVLVRPEQMVTKTLEDSANNRGLPVRTTVSPAEAYGFLDLTPPG